jgi:hypothetical protein
VESNPEIVLRGDGRESLSIAPTRREFPDLNDFWDGNWVYATVRLQAGAFRAEYEAQLRTTDFQLFRQQLGVLYERLTGTAAFDAMEDWIKLQVVGDGKGHMTAKCTARDYPGTGNTLTFTLQFDQTDVPRMLRELDAILAAFPVRGQPS